VNRKIIIDTYDPSWPAQFADERQRLEAAIGPHIDSIEHIGSTAVPGLGAKPVIDMLVGLRSLDDAASCIAPVVSLGYVYVPEFEAELPERRFFRRDINGQRSHHIHMVEVGSDFWVEHLRFRDYLCQHPQAVADYEALKLRLAAEFVDDVNAYASAKTEFVRGILAAAEAAEREPRD
jgi:GrpB-like predicted nucleotidyltransferase (UPF0157 family)